MSAGVQSRDWTLRRGGEGERGVGQSGGRTACVEGKNTFWTTREWSIERTIEFKGIFVDCNLQIKAVHIDEDSVVTPSK